MAQNLNVHRAFFIASQIPLQLAIHLLNQFGELFLPSNCYLNVGRN